MTRPAHDRRTPPPLGDEGFSLIEMAFVLAIVGSLMGMAWSVAGLLKNRTINHLIAWQMGTVLRAAQNYITVNEAAVESAASGGTYVIPAAALQSPPTYYLSPSFQNVTPYGGQYAVLVRKIAPGELESLVVAYGGKKLTDPDCGDVAANIGGDGGCVYSTDAVNARGTGGGWITAVTSFGGTAYTPSAGTPVASSFYEGGQVVAPYLYRYPVGTQTEPQTMHADINMNGQSIDNVKTLTIGGETISEPQAGALGVSGDLLIGDLGNQSVSKGVYNVNAYAPGSFVAAPSCPASMSAEIINIPVAAGDNGAGLPMSAFQQVTQQVAGGWTVGIRVLTQSGWTTVTAPYGYNVVITKCS